jgi:hypothetical protein
MALISFLGHADGVNKMGESIHSVKKDTEALLVAGREMVWKKKQKKMSVWSCLKTRMLYKTAHKDRQSVLRKCGTIRIFGNNLNGFHS